jgi:hypothetical protein
VGAIQQRGAPLDPRLPDATLRDWPQRLTQRLSEYLRTLAIEINRRLAFGTRTIYVPANAMTVQTTSGAASGTTELANKVMLSTLDFAADATEFAQFSVQMPKSWDTLVVRAKFLYMHATATASTSASAGVAWQLQAQAFSNGDSLNATFSTAVITSKIGIAPLTLWETPLTASYTIENSPAESDWVCFRVSRKHDDAADTFTDADAKLIGVTVNYSQAAMTDL